MWKANRKRLENNKISNVPITLVENQSMTISWESWRQCFSSFWDSNYSKKWFFSPWLPAHRHKSTCNWNESFSSLSFLHRKHCNVFYSIPVGSPTLILWPANGSRATVWKTALKAPVSLLWLHTLPFPNSLKVATILNFWAIISLIFFIALLCVYL